MSDWLSYSIADFIPFGRAVYLRLIERVSDAVWPLQWLLLVIALLIVIGAMKQYRRLVTMVLAMLWAWIAYLFLWRYYSELNWAGPWLALGFVGQGMLTVSVAFKSGLQVGPTLVQRYAGLALAGAGLAWPLLSRLSRESWSQSEFVGVHADPSVVYSLGILLIVCSGWRLALVLIVPCLWCVLSALTLMVLDLTRFWFLLAALLTVGGVAISALCSSLPKR